MVTKLVYKEFGFYQDLCDFVNKNKITSDLISEIVKDKENVILFYWLKDDRQYWGGVPVEELSGQDLAEWKKYESMWLQNFNKFTSP